MIRGYQSIFFKRLFSNKKYYNDEIFICPGFTNFHKISPTYCPSGIENHKNYEYKRKRKDIIHTKLVRRQNNPINK
jgi:hypothetical protein